MRGRIFWNLVKISKPRFTGMIGTRDATAALKTAVLSYESIVIKQMTSMIEGCTVQDRTE